MLRMRCCPDVKVLFKLDPKQHAVCRKFKDGFMSALSGAGMACQGCSSERMMGAVNSFIKTAAGARTFGDHGVSPADDDVFVLRLRFKSGKHYGKPAVLAAFPMSTGRRWTSLEHVAKIGYDVHLVVRVDLVARGDGVNVSGDCTFTICSATVELSHYAYLHSESDKGPKLDPSEISKKSTWPKSSHTPWHGGSVPMNPASYAAVKAAVEYETGRVTPDSTDDDDGDDGDVGDQDMLPQFSGLSVRGSTGQAEDPAHSSSRASSSIQSPKRPAFGKLQSPTTAKKTNTRK
jgi:hypothetical protein